MGTLKDKLIKSEKAEEMLSYILPLYDDDEYVLSMFEALGREYDLLFERIDELYKQPFINSSTWALKYWADLYGVEFDPDEAHSEMRDKIINFINAKQPINRNRIEVIVSGISETDVVVEEHFKGYTFHVILVSNDLSIVNREIWKRVYDAKPAHLAVRYYVQTDERLFHYDIFKKTFAPVIKFYNDIGRGYVRDRTIRLLRTVREGTSSPFHSGEMTGGVKTDTQKSKKVASDIGLSNEVNLGTASLQDSPFDISHPVSKKVSIVNSFVNLRHGESTARYCGIHYAGEGVN